MRRPDELPPRRLRAKDEAHVLRSGLPQLRDEAVQPVLPGEPDDARLVLPLQRPDDLLPPVRVHRRLVHRDDIPVAGGNAARTIRPER